MKNTLLSRWSAATRRSISVILLAAGLGVGAKAENPNPRVLPMHSSAHGMTYGEWAGAWWQWAAGIPADINPILDTTGEFGDVDQEGPVWFLAGSFGTSAERELTIPAGTSLFFPLNNSLWWAPDDVAFAAFFVETELGLDPTDFTEEELVELTAIAQASPESLELSCSIDGVELTDLESYFAVSPGFTLIDTDLLDDFGAAVSQPNTTFGAGHWIMLAPLRRGEHTIRFTADSEDPFWGEFHLDVTYVITVGVRRR